MKHTIAALLLTLCPLVSHAALPGADTLAGLILDEFDTNTDALLDGGEWQSGISGSFKKLDGNGDGSVTADDVDNLKPDLSDKTGEFTAGLLVALIWQVVLTLDTDKDKTVSRKEYDALTLDVFEKLDADQSKSLTRAELAELPVKLIAK